ncbi:MAG: hypothetical protein ACOYJJ_03440 [Anaerovoracaceae bacterium]
MAVQHRALNSQRRRHSDAGYAVLFWRFEFSNRFYRRDDEDFFDRGHGLAADANRWKIRLLKS